MRVIGTLFSNSPTGFGQAYINVVGNYTIAGPHGLIGPKAATLRGLGITRLMSEFWIQFQYNYIVFMTSLDCIN